MADSTKPGPLGRDLHVSPHTPGTMGREDAAAPDAWPWLLGNTPGTLGRTDWAAPDATATRFRLPPLTLHLDHLPKFDLGRFKLHSPLSQTAALHRPAPPNDLDEKFEGISDSKLTACATAEETTFKHQVYKAACRNAARKRKFFAGVPAGNLAAIEGKYQMRTDAAAAAVKLLTEMRATLKKEQDAKDAHALKVSSVTVTSGYRDPKKDFGLWDSYYDNYYKQTKTMRQAASGGEHGAAAVHLLAKYIGKYKAAPGYSNHTQGIAFDITTTEDAVHYTANKDQNSAWEKTWLRKWMLKNAGRFGFKKLETEAWHWDYKP